MGRAVPHLWPLTSKSVPQSIWGWSRTKFWARSAQGAVLENFSDILEKWFFDIVMKRKVAGNLILSGRDLKVQTSGETKIPKGNHIPYLKC